MKTFATNHIPREKSSMNNFRYYGEIDLSAAQAELAAHPGLWGTSVRTWFPNTPHSSVKDILLRFQDLSVKRPASEIDWNEAIDFPAAAALPQCMKLIYGLNFMIHGTRIGRAMLTKLAPGDKITPHTDFPLGIDYYWTRFHFVFQSAPGTTFSCGDESLEMVEGTLWSINNNKIHSVFNGSEVDRIHLIVDIQCPDRFGPDENLG